MTLKKNPPSHGLAAGQPKPPWPPFLHLTPCSCRENSGIINVASSAIHRHTHPKPLRTQPSATHTAVLSLCAWEALMQDPNKSDRSIREWWNICTWAQPHSEPTGSYGQSCSRGKAQEIITSILPFLPCCLRCGVYKSHKVLLSVFRYGPTFCDFTLVILSASHAALRICLFPSASNVTRPQL